MSLSNMAPIKIPSCQDISLIRTSDDQSKNLKSLHDWHKIIPNAAYFTGFDRYLFGNIIAVVYEDPITERISTVLIAKHGENQYNSLTIDARSRYFPACENLLPEYRKSNVRRSLAITILRAFANLDKNLKDQLLLIASQQDDEEHGMVDWDETIAGDLATGLNLIVNKIPTQVGDKILNLGYLQQKFSNALMLDIVYIDNEKEIDENNKLVFLLGEQLDQLFDPLTEYSPESTEKIYKVPMNLDIENLKEETNDNELTKSIIDELIKVQTNFTKNLVHFLQNFVVPLRIKALNLEIPNLTISKLNLIFPPTIDEITRINCVFLDSLKNALPFGSFEILRACGSTIPYFYKAYMRHEAATKNFSKQLNYFFENFSSYLINNNNNNESKSPLIDVDYFTKRKIDSLIHGSLNLIKLKLILNRLIENNQWSNNLQNRMHKYYQSTINTIDAFGRDKLKPYNNRVFTPTGKLLTELASDWPTELQYGWLARRVVSIFGGKNLICNNQYDQDIIIIFSDHILFLTINDKDYYRKQQQKNSDFYLNENHSDFKVHEPSIPDLLMHSLINKVPLSNLPKLKVSGWANIGDIYPSTYNEGKMIQFFVIGEGIKKSNLNLNVDSIKKYQINDVNKLNNGLKIIDLVNKAKILNKSSPFHLFKTRNLGLSIYSTAHEKSVYNEEKSKSPFALFLNMKITKNMLYENDLFAGLSAKFVKNNNVNSSTSNRNINDLVKEDEVVFGDATTIEGDDLIEIFGMTKDGSKIHEILPSSEFSTFLAEQLSNLYSNFLSYKNDSIVKYLISANDKLTNYLIQYVNNESVYESVIKEEIEDKRDFSTNTDNSVKHVRILEETPTPKKNVIKLLVSPSKKKLASSSSKVDLKRNSISSINNPIFNNINNKTASIATSKVTVGANVDDFESDEDDDIFLETGKSPSINHKYTKSKETLLSVFSSSDLVKDGKVIKPSLNTFPSSEKKVKKKVEIVDEIDKFDKKKKSSFFDKLFRRKSKSTTFIKETQVIETTSVIKNTSPVKLVTNSTKDFTNDDILTKEAPKKIHRTINKLFKSSQSIPANMNVGAGHPIKSMKSSKSMMLKPTISRETTSTFNSTMDETINTPSKVRSQQYAKDRRFSYHTPNDENRKIVMVQSSVGKDSIGDDVNSVSTPIRSKRSAFKVNEYKIRSSLSINDPAEINNSTIKPVVKDDDKRHSLNYDSSPLLNKINKKYSASSPTIVKKRNYAMAKDRHYRSSSLKTRNVNIMSNNPSRTSSFSTDNGKENYEHLEEITKMKLAKERDENLKSIKSHRKSIDSEEVKKRSSLSSEKRSIKSRASVFLDDYSDTEDDDLKKNWVLARENSSLANIQAALSKNNIHPMIKASNSSRNWTKMARDSSSKDLSKLIADKNSIKKTESGFSIYNNLMDDTMSPNWIIARDNSTLLNIPKDAINLNKGPTRSMSRSKNIYLTPYQNKLRASLNSFRSAEELNDEQKLYAMLMNKENFDSMNNISEKSDNKKVGEEEFDEEEFDDDDDDDDDDDGYYLNKEVQLSDDEGRFDDEGGDFDDDEDGEDEEFDAPRPHTSMLDDEEEDDEELINSSNNEDFFKFPKVASSIVSSSAMNDSSDDDDEPIPEDKPDIDIDNDAPEGGNMYQSSLLRGTFGFLSQSHMNTTDLIDEDLLAGFDDEEDDDEEFGDEESFDEPKQHGLMSTLPTISSFGGMEGPVTNRGYDDDDEEGDISGISRSISMLSGGIPRSMSLGGRRSQSFLGGLGLPELKDINETVEPDFPEEEDEDDDDDEEEYKKITDSTVDVRATSIRSTGSNKRLFSDTK